MPHTDVALQTDFAQDVLTGFSEKQKFISSKYFYDSKGDKIFQDIMHMPEYYLTNAEYDILDQQTPEIIQSLGFGKEPFELIEFGAGDGHKTDLILEYLVNKGSDFKFLPIDISSSVLEELEQNINRKFPDLDIKTLNDDYFSALSRIHEISSSRKCILFLGSNIGNFLKDEAISFLHRIYELLDPGDKLLIGFDLKKDPRIISKAYNDDAGHTRAFNLNLLHRMNRELGADFNVENFDHYPVYDPSTGAARSYIMSLKNQTVWFDALEKAFDFKQDELIYTEISQKYSLEDISELALLSGFHVKEHFFDPRNYFVDSLWEKTE